MRLNRLTNWVVLTPGINLLTISGSALDPVLALNCKWAEEMFPSTPAERLIILHEDEPGDTTEIVRPNSAPRTISVPLKGAKEFDLIVDDAGDGRGWDQGDWADARVALEDGSEIWLDNLPVDGGFPFSFVYGGKPCSEFLGHWTREVKTEKISDTTTRRTLTLTDPTTRLEVRAVCLVYHDTAGVDWTLHFTNKGDKDTPLIEQVKALDAAIAIGTADSVVLHRLNGAPCQAGRDCLSRI